MVKMVLALLKMEVREDMRAAIITAIIKPRSPGSREKGEFHSMSGIKGMGQVWVGWGRVSPVGSSSMTILA